VGSFTTQVTRDAAGSTNAIGRISQRKSHERVVAVPSLWLRPGGVLQQHGLGVSRPSGGANAVAGCWPTPGVISQAGFGPMTQAASALRPEVLCGFIAASFTTEARRSLLGGSRGKRQRCILEIHALQHLARPPVAVKTRTTEFVLDSTVAGTTAISILALSKYDFRIRPRLCP
jgi:hypothetical protein